MKVTLLLSMLVFVPSLVLAAPSVDLAWQDNSVANHRTAKFSVCRRVTGTPTFTEISTPTYPTSTYTDTGVANSTSYDYKVGTYDAANVLGAYSSIVTVAVGAAPVLPIPAPTNLTATPHP